MASVVLHIFSRENRTNPIRTLQAVRVGYRCRSMADFREERAD
jgi:hypothetical protein